MKISQANIALAALLFTSGITNAVYYKISTEAEIKESGRALAFDLLSYYKGNTSGQTPGILPGPPPAGDYYWWEGGAMWGTMIDYWFLTGDSTYNQVAIDGILWQVGPDRDFMPPNHTASLGNDDQGFWGMTAMLAAENGFPDPPSDQPQWLALAQAVFNTQADPSRHDATCGGGLRWQIPLSNNGYDYKNSIANGCFFNVGARLARYTGNATYAEWAEKTWDWMVSVGYIDAAYNVYDGGHVPVNCTDINKTQFSYNHAIFLLGAAYMYDYTGQSAKWKARIDGLLKSTLDVFFPGNIATEIACEEGNTCTTDMYSFKGYVARWLSTMTKLAPYTKETILPVLKTSCQAAVNQCVGGASGRVCGFKWSSGVYDGKTGAGQQMNVLACVSSLLIENARSPLTATTGGTSKGDPNAGSGSNNYIREFAPVTTGDKAGAGILTILILGSAVGAFGWMSVGA